MADWIEYIGVLIFMAAAASALLFFQRRNRQREERRVGEAEAWAKAAEARARRAEAIADYLVRRLEQMSALGDPARDVLPEVLEGLGLDERVDYAGLREARDRLYTAVPTRLAIAIEKLLTGDIWDETDSQQRLGDRPPGG